MYVEVVLGLHLDTKDVDEAGSIVAAVEGERFGVIRAVRTDEWTWQYESGAEEAWHNNRATQPLTGEPWAPEDET